MNMPGIYRNSTSSHPSVTSNELDLSERKIGIQHSIELESYAHFKHKQNIGTSKKKLFDPKKSENHNCANVIMQISIQLSL